MQWFVLVRLDGGVDGEWVQSVHCGVVDCADDPGWHDDVPGCVVCFAVLPEDVFPASPNQYMCKV